jgi:hypothetical protein
MTTPPEISIIEHHRLFDTEIAKALQSGLQDFHTARPGALIGVEWSASVYQGSVNPGGVSHFILKDEDGDTRLMYYPDMVGRSRAIAADLGMLLPTDRTFTSTMRSAILGMAGAQFPDEPDDTVSIRVFRHAAVLLPFDTESRSHFVKYGRGGITDQSIQALVQVATPTSEMSQHEKLALSQEIDAITTDCIGWGGLDADKLHLTTRWGQSTNI